MSSESQSVRIEEITTDHLDSLKRNLLINSTNSSRKDVICTLTEMLQTYQTELRVGRKGLPDLPNLILQVDMIYAISQIMATSDTQLFSCTLTLLNSFFRVPLLRGKLNVVVESGLRIASMVVKSDYSVIGDARKFFLSVLADLEIVPLSIQRQVITVYRKLPDWLEPKELLEWTQLLLYCPVFLDTLPVKVYTDFVKVLIGHMKDDNIVKMCLNFLADSFKKLPHAFVRDVCISDKDFLKFLSDKICAPCSDDMTEDGFISLCLAFDIVHRYVVAMHMTGKVENVNPIQMNLTRLIPHLTQYAVSDSILILLAELLREDLNNNGLKIEEDDPNVVAELLTTFHFLVLSLAHKAVLVRSQINVWNFLRELLRFSARNAGQALRAHKPELNCWNLIAMSALMPPNEPLLSHPIEFWKFVLDWIKLLNIQKKSFFRIPSHYQCFNYGSFVATLDNRINAEILIPFFLSENRIQESQANNTGRVDGGGVAVSSSRRYRWRNEKEEIVAQIGSLCHRIRDSSIDWESESDDLLSTSFLFDDDDDEGEIVNNNVKTDTDEIQKRQVSTEEFDSDATCSLSELNL